MAPLLLSLALLQAPALGPSLQGDAAARLAQLHAEVDELHKGRAREGALEEEAQKLKEAEALAPGDYGTLWRKARLTFWRAETGEGDARERLAKQAWDEAELAVKANPKAGEGHYYAGISIGVYSQEIGVPKALLKGLEGKFNGHIDHALRLVPALEQGGASTTKGRYHYELPWPKRDLDESERILRAVVKSFPGNLRARLYLAETLLAQDEPKQAKALLDEIAGLSPGRDPAEEALIKARAKALAPKVDKELR